MLLQGGLAQPVPLLLLACQFDILLPIRFASDTCSERERERERVGENQKGWREGDSKTKVTAICDILRRFATVYETFRLFLPLSSTAAGKTSQSVYPLSPN